MIKNELDKRNELPFKRLNVKSKVGLDPKRMIYKIKKLYKDIDYAKLVCVHTNGKIYDFNISRRSY